MDCPKSGRLGDATLTSRLCSDGPLTSQRLADGLQVFRARARGRRRARGRLITETKPFPGKSSQENKILVDSNTEGKKRMGFTTRFGVKDAFKQQVLPY
jgi:hypothetical protein